MSQLTEPGQARHGRGRRPNTPEQQEKLRARIVAATRKVFADHGYYDVSVARILERADISRPTFYRYFRNIEQPLATMLADVGRELLVGMSSAVDAADGDVAKVVAAIDAYMTWCRSNADILKSMQAGLHDLGSPVSQQRSKLLDLISSFMIAELQRAGRPIFEPFVIDVFMNSVEYTSYQLHLRTQADVPSTQMARTLMVRTALALFGTADDWQVAARLLDDLTISSTTGPDPDAAGPPGPVPSG